MAGAKRGRIPKLTPEVQEAIVTAVAGGVPRRSAAERAGVSPRSLERWLARGRREKRGPYVAFLAAMKKARADRMAASVARIGRAAQGGRVIDRKVTTTKHKDGSVTTKVVERFARAEWTADAWFLERAHPDEFAGNRREVRELRRQLAAILKAVADGRVDNPAANRNAVVPKVGGEARAESV